MLYVGRATSLRSRIGQYFTDANIDRTRTNYRAWLLVMRGRAMEIAWRETLDLELARALEAELLDRYEDDRDELPPLNRRVG